MRELLRPPHDLEKPIVQAITTVSAPPSRHFRSSIDAEGNDHFSVFAAVAGSVLKDHRDEAITHTGRIVSIALILTKQ